jgi:hypothetical protein
LEGLWAVDDEGELLFCYDPEAPFPQKVGTLTVTGNGRKLDLFHVDGAGDNAPWVKLEAKDENPSMTVEANQTRTFCVMLQSPVIDARMEVVAAGPTDDASESMTFWFKVQQPEPEPEPEEGLDETVHDVAPATGPDQVCSVRTGVLGLQGAFNAIVGHDGGLLVLDAKTGGTVHDRPVGLQYGGCAIGAPEEVQALLGYGPDGVTASPYLPGQPGSWGAVQELEKGDNVTDACLSPDGTGTWLVNNTDNEIKFAVWDSSAGALDIVPESRYVFTGNAGEVLVSACEDEDGNVLMLTVGTPGGLWELRSGATTATRIGDAGDASRRVRVRDGVVSVTDHGGGISLGGISLYYRDDNGDLQPIAFGIAGRPIGTDLKRLPNGNVRIAFASNTTWGTIDVDPSDGTVVDSQLWPLPDGVTGATGVAFLGDANCSILVTGNTSGNAAVINTK